jgi:hypothetical protein
LVDRFLPAHGAGEAFALISTYKSNNYNMDKKSTTEQAKVVLTCRMNWNENIILGGVLDNFHCRIFSDTFVFRDLGMLQQQAYNQGKSRLDIPWGNMINI